MRIALCLFALTVLPAAAQVKITPGAVKIAVEIDGKPFTEFFVAGPDTMKPYLHPLRAASGTSPCEIAMAHSV